MELSSAVFRDILSPLAAFKEITAREENFSSGRDAPTTLHSDQTVPDLDPTQATSSPCQRSQDLEDQAAKPSEFPFRPATPRGAITNYRWTIQGADPDARRFFAVPQFTLDQPPFRIDVYLPPLEDYLPEVRDILKPEEVIYAPRGEVPALRISQWLTGVLEQWCVAYDSSASGRKPGRLNGDESAKGKFQREYEAMPFGSRILVTIGGLSNSSGGVTVDHEIYLEPDYYVEQGMLTADSLREMWGASHGNTLTGQSAWPEVIDLEDLHLKRQFHEAISVVTISPSPSVEDGKGPPEPEKEWIFKSLTRDQRYLYNELRMFLSLEPHENIISKPRYIVTKKGRFGGRKGVCGFVLEYFPGGSLKQFLLNRSISQVRGGSSLGQKIHWAKQVTRALVHINTNDQPDSSEGGNGHGFRPWFGFYPDLKPDNIVLRPSSSSAGGVLYDVVLIDLEQRGGWFSWSPPEISYLEYLEIILAADVNELEAQGYDVDQLEEVQDEVKSLLGEYYSLCFDRADTGLGTRAAGQNRQGQTCAGGKYYNSDGGFSKPWLTLLAKRKAGAMTGRHVESTGQDDGALDLEKAQVFMLGKLLWCIFEEEALMRCGIDHEMLSDRVDLDGSVRGLGKERKLFPEFEHTPEEIRGLIKRCTAGAGEWEKDGCRGWRVVLNGDGNLVPASVSGRSACGGDAEHTAEDTQDEATLYWKGEVEKARSFVVDMVGYEKHRRGIPVGSSDESGQTDEHRDGILGDGYEEPALLKQVRSRPTLGDALDVLESIRVS